MGKTAISWTASGVSEGKERKGKSWNPWTGCSRLSAGCEHCYAERLSLENGWSALPWTRPNLAANLVWHSDRLGQPASWREPTRIFVESMADLFHPEVPVEWLVEVERVMATVPRHTYMTLTKRASVMRERLSHPDVLGVWRQAGGDYPPPHVWRGVSIENRKSLPRLELLRATPAAVRWVSAEPLLEDLGDLDLTGIDWVVVGGESGPGYRDMDHAWAYRLWRQCVEQGVAYYFKQSSGGRAGAGAALTFPDGSQYVIRQWPGELNKPELVSAAGSGNAARHA